MGTPAPPLSLWQRRARHRERLVRRLLPSVIETEISVLPARPEQIARKAVEIADAVLTELNAAEARDRAQERKGA